jgi:hypothetical protein
MPTSPTYYIIRLPSWLINSRIAGGLFIYTFFPPKALRPKKDYKGEELN